MWKTYSVGNIACVRNLEKLDTAEAYILYGLVRRVKII